MEVQFGNLNTWEFTCMGCSGYFYCHHLEAVGIGDADGSTGEAQAKHQLEPLQTFSLHWALQVRRTWPASAVGGKGGSMLGREQSSFLPPFRTCPFFFPEYLGFVVFFFSLHVSPIPGKARLNEVWSKLV